MIGYATKVCRESALGAYSPIMNLYFKCQFRSLHSIHSDNHRACAFLHEFEQKISLIVTILQRVWRLSKRKVASFKAGCLIMNIRRGWIGHMRDAIWGTWIYLLCSCPSSLFHAQSLSYIKFLYRVPVASKRRIDDEAWWPNGDVLHKRAFHDRRLPLAICFNRALWVSPEWLVGISRPLFVILFHIQGHKMNL